MNPGGTARPVATSNEVWVESDRQRDAARSLEMVNAQLVSAAVDPYSWTWVLHAVHRAIRIFIAASAGPPNGSPLAMPMPGLRVRGGDSGRGTHDLVEGYRGAVATAGVEAFPAVERGLERMTRLHDEMERIPEGWAMRINDLPYTTRSCLKVCEQLGWSPGVIRWSDGRIADLARAKYAGSVQILDALDGEYNGD